MLQLVATSLPPHTQGQLTKYQTAIDAIADYAERVETAKQRFSSANRPDSKTFNAVKATLTTLCSGARRCMYCEDSCGDEVEHIRPKDLYPELTFVWENYLYACGPCNSPKKNQFAVFLHSTGRFTEVTRPRDAPVIPPVKGDPVLIDPRREDPLKFMALDLRDTFYFCPLAQEGTTNYERARYTIKVLGLNKRDQLCKARREAYINYRARLQEYIIWRDKDKPARDLQALIAALQDMSHPTVWQEIKRQHKHLPDLEPLFQQAPVALTW